MKKELGEIVKRRSSLAEAIPLLKMDKEIQQLIDERQELLDRLCMEIINVEEGRVKVRK